ncbi:hypothetical protein P3T76_004304 [Phytophthora citrophthora]|uniref:Uncharacterized protein n=1 Tax=Phytophthora citrophthora TaxID=4793 RepID=A0AAD9LR84_9STRA|nr:hypothetical protein P3T76_004304 [Phytophthora citrophthora]
MPERLPSALSLQKATNLAVQTHYADMSARFSVEHVLSHGEIFFHEPLLPDERLLDRDARRNLASEIILSRPQAHLRRLNGATIRQTDRPKLRRYNLIYLVRLAPLMHQTGRGEWELTATGNFFSTLRVPNVGLKPYHGKVVAKFGLTTQEVGSRFLELIPHLRRQGFPQEDLNPFYALYITGMSTDSVLLRRIESGVRNLFDNLGFRLRQHAEGVQHPDNRSMLSEMVETVYTDWQCDTAYTLLVTQDAIEM